MNKTDKNVNNFNQEFIYSKENNKKKLKNSSSNLLHTNSNSHGYVNYEIVNSNLNSQNYTNKNKVQKEINYLS